MAFLYSEATGANSILIPRSQSRVELVRGEHGQRRLDALSHLGLVDDDGVFLALVGRDAHPGVGPANGRCGPASAGLVEGCPVPGGGTFGGGIGSVPEPTARTAPAESVAWRKKRRPRRGRSALAVGAVESGSCGVLTARLGGPWMARRIRRVCAAPAEVPGHGLVDLVVGRLRRLRQEPAAGMICPGWQ